MERFIIVMTGFLVVIIVIKQFVLEKKIKDAFWIIENKIDQLEK